MSDTARWKWRLGDRAITALLVLAAGIAGAQQQFNVGDRVTITATGEKGTVLTSTPNTHGGFDIKVQLDRFGRHPVGPIYDTSAVPITNESHGQGQTPADPGVQAPQAPIQPTPPSAPVAPQGPAEARRRPVAVELLFSRP